MGETWRRLQPAVVIRLRPGAPRTVFPDVRCDLVWDGDRWTVSGPQSRPRFQVASRCGLLLSLEPSQARRWLRTPLSHLTDVTAPIEDVSPRLADELGHAAGWAPPADGAWRGHSRLAASERMLRGGARVREAAAAAALSPRQFERSFTAEFGLAPKRFARIVRFRRACDWLRSGASLADAAAASGYADQPHFARDCAELGAITPAELRRRVANVQDAVKGDFAS